MADAVVQVVNNRAQVVVYGASLLSPLVAAAEAAAEIAQAAVADLPGVFRETVTDPLLTTTIKEAYVFGAWAHEDFYLNVRFFDYGGPPFGKWPSFRLHDSNGDVVAQWSKVLVDPATESEWIFLTNLGDGSPLPGVPYQGIVVGLRVDWAAVTALGWNDNLTTHTTTAGAGIRPEHNRPPEALLAFLGQMTPDETLTVGADGDYATVNAAVEASWIDDGTVIGRSTLPNSDRANPARLLQIRALDKTLDEAITPRTVGGTSTGLVLPNWGELFVPEGGRLKILAGDAPVIEMNGPGRLRGGGTAENFGEGYALHIDPDDTMQRAENGPAIMRHYGVHLVEGWTFIAHGTTSTAIPVAGALSNGMKVLFRRCTFLRSGGTAPLVALHTTPSTTDEAEIGFEDCYFDPAYVAAQFLKKHTTPTGLRHKVWFRNCEGGAIQYGDSGFSGGTVPFVRAGTITGFSSVDTDLNPS